MNENRRPGWRPSMLSICLLTSLLLVVSWLWPATRAGWNDLDTYLFHWLNGSLSADGVRQAFWAITNWRPFDLVGGMAILSVAVFWLRRESGADRFMVNITEMLLFAALLIVFNVAVQVLFEFIDYSRPSPTKVFPDAVRLSENILWIDAKDTSSDSFPGDHAYVLISMAVFYTFRAGWRTGIAAAFLFFPFILPRLVSGAHWATDVLVGSIAMSLIVISLWFATPMGTRLTQKSYRKVQSVLQRLLAKFPIFHKWR